MKSKIILLAACCILTIIIPKVQAQQVEIEQLILNIEKLNQLRAILDNMYKGYQILNMGYNTIKDLAEGNFDLHKIFLDGLLEVSPTIRNSKRLIDIVSMQQQLTKEYKSALNKFRSAQVFNSKELNYLENVYENLINRSLQNLDELVMIVTAGQLRMNDAERLASIDHVYSELQDKLQFLRQFNNRTSVLVAQRVRSKNEIEALLRIYGLKK